MNVDITGHHVEVSDALRSYINEKLERLARHFDHVGLAHVIMKVEKGFHAVEANIPLNGTTLFANATADTMYAAIDNLVDKLDRQIKKHKEKHCDHHNHEGRKSELYE
jgi:putative sigma-54 modulation protein